jgi:hypothetical protein
MTSQKTPFFSFRLFDEYVVRVSDVNLASYVYMSHPVRQYTSNLMVENGELRNERLVREPTEKQAQPVQLQLSYQHYEVDEV